MLAQAKGIQFNMLHVLLLLTINFGVASVAGVKCTKLAHEGLLSISTMIIDFFGSLLICIILLMTLSELFDTFEQSAFRLEGLSVYSVHEEKEALEYYKKCGRIPVGFGDDWAKFVKQQTESGKIIQRLRLLSDQPTEYETFELNAYSGLRNGEDIRYAKRSDHSYDYDFWLFDSRWLARMDYDINGEYVGSYISEVTQENQVKIGDWLALYNSAPSVSELISGSE